MTHKNDHDIQPLFLAILFIAGAVFIYFWLAGFGNTPQVFTDVVHELTSAEGSNKSAERDMVYILSVAGSFAVFFFYLFYNKKHGAKAAQTADRSMNVLGLILMTALGVSYLVYGGLSPVIFSLTILWILLYISSCSYALSAMAAFVFTLYGLCGLYRLFVFSGWSRDAGIGEILVLSFAITGILLYASNKSKKDIFLAALPYIQMLIPFTLLVFLSSSYSTADSSTVIAATKRISLPIWALIIGFELMAVLKKINCSKKSCGLDEIISFGSLCCIMNFNGYSGLGSIISSDLHHPFENIIAFSQIFELGQKPFSEYIPVSGLYSIIQGAFLSVFGGGYYSNYNVTENLFYLCISALLLFIAMRHIKSSRVLLIVLLFPILRYNRIALILPVMLLLSWPGLIKKRGLWIMAWFLSSLVQGLYYPLFGAAVCIGFMPLLLWQLTGYVKGDLKNDIKKPAFWACAAACLLPAVLCIPLLLGTLKHMLAMSSQTIFADGLSRFGQGMPDSFLSGLNNTGLRILLYDLFSFLIPVAVVWVSAILCMKLGNIRIEGKKLRISDPEAAAISASVGIAMIVAFSYTLVRMDVYDIYARSAGMIFASAVMFLTIGWRYLGNGLSRYIISAFAVFLISAVMGEAVQNIDANDKLSASYKVPDGYIAVNDGEVPRLGPVYVQENIYSKLLSRRENDNGINDADSYLGLGDFGYFYLYNIRGGSVMEAMTIRGYGAAEETVDILRKTGTVVSGVDSFAYYYLYRWLMTSGEYGWSEENRKFYPAAQGAEEALRANKTAKLASEERELGRTPSSWGLSMESLEDIFTAPGVGLTEEPSEYGGTYLGFDKNIQGEDADFLYIEFDNSDGSYDNILIDHIFDAVQDDTSAFATALMKRDYNPGKTVRISWSDDAGNSHLLNCDFGRGRLLIPLGCGAGWLLNSHDGVNVNMQYYGEDITVSPIKEYRLLKLREVE